MVAESTTLSDEQKMEFIAEAARCVQTLRSGGANLGHIEYSYVAAALALMSGHFLKQNGKPNPTATARAFGKETTRSNAGALDAPVPTRAPTTPPRHCWRARCATNSIAARRPPR